ncbi:MAG TPA: YerC/YecD family TrpR-related protein [Candidatus Absconditabacterales bacterium]|nr:YerC/YecD family TrpR-related protein [Candidatus Absconditabacterales bacterium]
MDIHHLQKVSEPLQKAFLQLTSKHEVFNFLRDLLTQEEIIELSQRLDIAYRLQKGEIYKKIEEETGASSTTIARVAKFLNGEFGGYRKALKK